jgi:hypothetical protein
VLHRWRLVSPKLPFNKSVDVIGHVLALIARLFEHLAAIPSVIDNRVDDAAYAYEDGKSNQAAPHRGLRWLPRIIVDAGYYRGLRVSKSQHGPLSRAFDPR